MPTRRQLLAAGTAVIGGGGGYAVFAVGDDEYEAAPGSVPSDVLATTGYERTEAEYVDDSRSVSIAGIGRTIGVTSRRTLYEKPLDIGFGSFRIANVTLVSTPSVRILGEERNPLAGMDDERFSRRIEEESESLSGLERTGEGTASMLGKTVTVGRYEGINSSDRLPVEVSVVALVVEPVEHEGDYLSVVCAYPTFLADTERANALRIIESVEHAENVGTQGAER